MRDEDYAEVLKQLPDSRGECDRCHYEPVPLWTLPGPGGFQFCRSCLEDKVRIHRHKRALVIRDAIHDGTYEPPEMIAPSKIQELLNGGPAYE